MKKEALMSVAALFASCAENYRKLDPESAEFKAAQQEVNAALLEPEPEPATQNDFEAKVLESLESLELHVAALAGQ